MKRWIGEASGPEERRAKVDGGTRRYMAVGEWMSGPERQREQTKGKEAWTAAGDEKGLWLSGRLEPERQWEQTRGKGAWTLCK